MHHELTLQGFECDKMMGGKDMDWADRDQVMRRFRRGDQHILLATDLVSWGIDIPGLKVVINFDVPFEKDEDGFFKASKETYLHRIGRTGRFDTKGIAINLIKGGASAKQELKYLEEIKTEYGSEITELKSAE